MWRESEAVLRMRQLYPAGGSMPFHTGHLPYVHAVAVTLIARGIEVLAVRLPRPPFDPDAGPRAAELELAPSAWAHRFPASPVPMTVTWSEAFGWNYTIDSPANNGLAFGAGEDMTLRSRGIGPNVSLVADPHDVADAVTDLLAGKDVEPAGWVGRSPELQDADLEMALAAYRDHPGAAALDGKSKRYLITHDVLLGLNRDMLASLAGRPHRAAVRHLVQVRSTATRYEFDIPASPARDPVVVERVDRESDRWVVTSASRGAQIYLMADGQETSVPQTHSLETAMRIARQACAGREQAPPDGGPNRAVAWTQPLPQTLTDQASRRLGAAPPLRADSGRARSEHRRGVER